MHFSDQIYPKREEKPKTLGGIFCWYIEKTIHNYKHLLLRNKSFTDIIFILTYLTEQAIFIYFMFTEKYSAKTLTSFFVLFLLTTMAIEKVLMELRYTTLKEFTNKLVNNNLNLTNKTIKLTKILGLKKLKK